MRVCGKSLKMTQVGSPNPLSGGAVVFLVVGGSTQPISKPLFPLPASSPLPPIPAPGNNIGGVILDTTSCKQQPPSPLLWGEADCIGYKKKLAQTGRLMAPLNCGVNCPQCWYSVFPPKRRSTRRFFFVSSPPPPISFPRHPFFDQQLHWRRPIWMGNGLLCPNDMKHASHLRPLQSQWICG